MGEALRWGVVVGACAVGVQGGIERYPDATCAAALLARLAVTWPVDVGL